MFRPRDLGIASLLATGLLCAAVPRQGGGAAGGAVGGVLAGTVWDSAAAAPLAGAAVLLAHATRADLPARSVTADADGRFVARDLPAGRWVVSFLHRSVDEYGVVPVPREVTLGEDDSVGVALALPAAAAMRAAVCGVKARSDSSGILVGSVRDEDTGRWLGGATVSIAWRVMDLSRGPRLLTRRIPVTTTHDGTFRICGLPGEDTLNVRAEYRGGAGGAGAPAAADTLLGGELFVRVAGTGISRVQLGVGRVARAGGPARTSRREAAEPRLVGAAALTGVVSDPDGRPRPDTRVVVLGAGQEVTTNDAGAYRFDSLPGGSWTVEARAVGLAPVRTTVLLRRDSTVTAPLVFGRWIPTLDRIMVMGRKRSEDIRMEQFLARRERGLGRFFGEEEIRRSGVSQLSHLLATIPNVRVRLNAFSDRPSIIEGRGGCMADVFVNGVRVNEGALQLDLLARPSEVMAIEVHDDVNGVPASFGGTRQCVVIGIWTRL